MTFDEPILSFQDYDAILVRMVAESLGVPYSVVFARGRDPDHPARHSACREPGAMAVSPPPSIATQSARILNGIYE